jgi:hypothetical protein
VVDAVEELLQINIHHPVVALADIGLGGGYRLVGTPPRPEAVAVDREARLKHRG